MEARDETPTARHDAPWPLFGHSRHSYIRTYIHRIYVPAWRIGVVFHDTLYLFMKKSDFGDFGGLVV